MLGALLPPIRAWLPRPRSMLDWAEVDEQFWESVQSAILLFSLAWQFVLSEVDGEHGPRHAGPG